MATTEKRNRLDFVSVGKGKEYDDFILQYDNQFYDLRNIRPNAPMIPIQNRIGQKIDIIKRQKNESILYQGSLPIVEELEEMESNKNRDKKREEILDTSLAEEMIAVTTEKNIVNYKIPQKKHIFSFAISTILVAIIISMSLYNFLSGNNTLGIFWAIFSLPILGISNGTMLILLGKDKDRYFVDG